jgi:predicted DNA-binding transcriptional regulator AlpA
MTEVQHTFNEREAAKYVGVSAAVLRLWRSENKGPRFFRAGEKLVRYRRTDLDQWIEERLSAPATDAR